MELSSTGPEQSDQSNMDVDGSQKKDIDTTNTNEQDDGSNVEVLESMIKRPPSGLESAIEERPSTESASSETGSTDSKDATRATPRTSSEAASRGSMESARPVSNQQPQTSQWGSYFRRAVANVEQTLDKVLQESSTEVNVARQPTKVTAGASGGRPSMHERLALAVGRSSSGSPISPRESFDNPQAVEASQEDDKESPVVLKPIRPVDGENLELPSLDVSVKLCREILKAIQQMDLPAEQGSGLLSSFSALVENLEEQNTRLNADSIRQQQKLESLEQRLLYLSKNEAQRAKQAKSSSSGLARKLAEREEHIALLFEEGQIMSRQELKHMNTIKKLRAKERDFDKVVDGLTKRVEKAEMDASEAKEKLKHATESEKKLADRLKNINKLETELTTLKADKEQATAKMSKLEAAMSEMTVLYEGKAAKLREEALATANTKVDKLQTELDQNTSQLKLTTDRYNGEVEALQCQLQDEIDGAGRIQATLRNEIKGLEAKVEHYRALSEDASTRGTSKDVQLNLLRQVEVMQSQHAVATENWHGIEANLLGRISSLEKELEDSKTQESYIRKKLKSSVSA
jgi:chromosome segregation ATPase